jgi:hypothetical protein
MEVNQVGMAFPHIQYHWIPNLLELEMMSTQNSIKKYSETRLMLIQGM